MWIRTAIKLPHDLSVCQKTEGNSAGDFHGGGERKTPTSWIRTAIKSPTTPCIWWKSLTSRWETITVRIGLKAHIQGVVGDLIAVRIHISEFTRRNRFKIQCLIPFWALPNTVTLYFGVIYILFLKCWKVFKRTILHDCSTTATGSRKRRKTQTFKWVFIMAAAGMQYNFKMCIINRYISRIIIYNYSASIFLFLNRRFK